MRFKTLEFPDRAAWLAWRHQGIGSSDASIIAGVSRFKTPKQLLLEKAGPVQPEDDENKYIKERGNRIEEITRKLLEANSGYSLAASNVVSNRFEFVRASLDGHNPDRKIIAEIKLLSSQSKERFNRGTEGYQKWAAAKLHGVVPQDHYVQMQHQLFVTGYDQCIYAGVCEVRGNPIDGDSIAQVIVDRDDKFIKELIDKEFQFWYALDSMAYGGELE
jgi:putative phage-type endonuclease